MCPFTKILNTVLNVVVDEVTVRGRCHWSTRKNKEAHHLQVFLIGCRNWAVNTEHAGSHDTDGERETSDWLFSLGNSLGVRVWLSGRALRQQRKRLWVRFPGNTYTNENV